MGRPGTRSRRQKQELLVGAVLAGSHVRLPSLFCFDPSLCADIAAAIAQCRTSGRAPDPPTIATMTGINRHLLEKLADDSEGIFGLDALDLVCEIERDRNRHLVRLASEMLATIGDEADSRTFDLRFAALVDGHVFDAIVGDAVMRDIASPTHRRSA